MERRNTLGGAARGSTGAARAASVVGENHEGAWVDNEREHDPRELVQMLLRLTDGELNETRDWREGGKPSIGPRVTMLDLAEGINEALREAGARGQLYSLAYGGFAYATVEQVEQLARRGILACRYEVPAERVQQFLLEPGSTARMYPNGKLHVGELMHYSTIDGVTCARGPLALAPNGSLLSCTLAVAHTFFGVRVPAGSRATFWSKEHPAEIELSESVVIRGLEIPLGSTLHFGENGGLTRVELATELLFDGGRAEAGDWLAYDSQLGWTEHQETPLWRPHRTDEVTFDDCDVASLNDLAQSYPLPEGFLFEAIGARFYVRRIADQALFSIELSGEILRFCEMRYCSCQDGMVTNDYKALKVRAGIDPREHGAP